MEENEQPGIQRWWQRIGCMRDPGAHTGEEAARDCEIADLRTELAIAQTKFKSTAGLMILHRDKACENGRRIGELETELANVKAALATAEKMLEERDGIPATFEIDKLSFLKMPEGAQPGEEFPMKFPTFTASRDEVFEAGARALYERSGDPADSILYRAHQLILDAKSAGQVLTIELKPLKPLAMGNYFMVADVRPARAKVSGQ